MWSLINTALNIQTIIKGSLSIATDFINNLAEFSQISTLRDYHSLISWDVKIYF